jgi:hypothetical protein
MHTMTPAAPADRRGQCARSLIDGNRVHHAAGHDCLIRYGERWHGGAATAALVATRNAIMTDRGGL